MPTRGARTRQRLLDAALASFAERGFHATRVDDIVKRAKTSHGTFYLYFENKEQVFHSLAHDVGEQLARATGDLGPVGPGADGRAVVRAWLERFTDAYVAAAPIVRTWTEAEIASDSTGQLGETLLGSFSAKLAEGFAGNGNGSGLDAAVAGTVLLAMIERLNYYVLTGTVPIERDALLDTLSRVVHATLAP